MHISVISPVYNAENIISTLVLQLHEQLKTITQDYEIILVNDASSDKSWAKIEEEGAKDKSVRGINLSRNFGQHYAITAGLDNATGEWVVVMDCDLQDQPSEIIKLYTKTKEGFDVVLAQRYDRKDTFFKHFFSKIFWKTLGFLTGTHIDHTVANFGIYHTKVIKAVCSLRESIRFFPTMVLWVGFKKTAIKIEHAARHSGKSNYNYSRMFKLASDVILAYSDKPIRIFTGIGLFISLISMLMGLYYFILNALHKIAVPGYTSIIISIWFLGGLIISILGVLGLYIGKTFEGVKNRPIYIVDKKINLP